MYLWGSILLMISISASYGMFEYTKRYSFCKGCHEMNQAHDTWIASKHGPILGQIDSCIACHAQEGTLGYIKAKLAGFKSLYYHITGQITGRYLDVAKGTKPVYCMKTGCHAMKDLDKGLKIRVNHQLHAQMGFECVSCHDRIAHGWDEDLRGSPNMQETCFGCHDNKIAPHDECGICHVYQKKMLKGAGGVGLENMPSPHGDELSCKDCHTHACALDLQTCSSCHDSSLIDEKNQVQADVSFELEELGGTLRQLERILKRYESSGMIQDGAFFEDEQKQYDLAKANYEFISRDLSRGIHNVEYTMNMLELSKENANRAIISFQGLVKHRSFVIPPPAR